MSYDVLLTRPGRYTFPNENNQTQQQQQQQQLAPAPKDERSQSAHTSPKRDVPAVRKISSSKFMAAFSQFYGNEETVDDAVDSPAGATRPQQVQKPGDESFPEIKGRVESKLMSMWHNVKYGKESFSI